MNIRQDRMSQHVCSFGAFMVVLSVLLLPAGCNGPETMPDGSVDEDCVSIDPSGVEVKKVEGSWKIVDGSHWIDDFGNKEQEARKALKIIQHYQLDQYCYVGRPDPSFTYLLSGGSAPSGSMSGEDCNSFNPNTTQVKKVDGSWKIVDGSHWIYDFGNKEGEARKALKIIKKYGFKHNCYVGRPDPSFHYLK